jgi:hypothetical protein
MPRSKDQSNGAKKLKTTPQKTLAGNSSGSTENGDGSESMPRMKKHQRTASTTVTDPGPSSRPGGRKRLTTRRLRRKMHQRNGTMLKSKKLQRISGMVAGSSSGGTEDGCGSESMPRRMLQRNGTMLKSKRLQRMVAGSSSGSTENGDGSKSMPRRMLQSNGTTPKRKLQKTEDGSGDTDTASGEDTTDSERKKLQRTLRRLLQKTEDGSGDTDTESGEDTTDGEKKSKLQSNGTTPKSKLQSNGTTPKSKLQSSGEDGDMLRKSKLQSSGEDGDTSDFFKANEIII